MKMHEIIIDKEKCTGCGMCKKECVAYNLTIEEKKAKAIANDCVMCGHCVAVCLKGAIAISGYDTEPIEKEQETFLNPEDVMNVIRFRRTVRQFKEKQIPQEVIEQILEAGRLTHTARNKQDVSFIVLDKEKDKVEEYAVGFVHKIKPVMNLFSPMIRRNKIGNHFFFYQAPIVIVITAKDKINGILAAQNMEFVAEANGLGVLFSGFFTNAANVSYKIKKILGIQKGKKVVATLVIGYPKVKYQRSVQREKIDVKYR
ncbi:nitroreductase family protein [Anaerosporobacter sp.]|uniref:nitroreductase family protein n=1 Tax=Anaerosporobacter sp. TaxID=1872529 RepID=UPI00286F70A3|nr:nitroreductase family protein [Anaerosporobacter sp.]